MTKEEKEAKSREENRLQHQKDVAELFSIINAHREKLNKIKIRKKIDGTLHKTTTSAIEKELSGYGITFNEERYYINCTRKSASYGIYLIEYMICIDELPVLSHDDISKKRDLINSYKKRIGELEFILKAEKDDLYYYGIYM